MVFPFEFMSLALHSLDLFSNDSLQSSCVGSKALHRNALKIGKIKSMRIPNLSGKGVGRAPFFLCILVQLSWILPVFVVQEIMELWHGITNSIFLTFQHWLRIWGVLFANFVAVFWMFPRQLMELKSPWTLSFFDGCRWVDGLSGKEDHFHPKKNGR